METSIEPSPRISIVIPVYNESENLRVLQQKLRETLAGMHVSYEIVFVNDGSTDSTIELLKELQKTEPCMVIINLRRNFGHHSATFAGFDHARGDIIVTMDGDLQNDPADIPKLLKKFEEGYDVVCGWRKNRKDPWFSRRLPSLITNRLISRETQTPVHDFGCFLRMYKPWAAREISKYSTFRGWFPVLFGILGFRVAEVEVTHHARRGAQTSKHSFFLRLDQFMSVFTGVTVRPFQFVEFLGMGSIALGFLVLVWWLVLCAMRLEWMAPVPLFLSLGAMAWGFLSLVLGLIGEYVVRMQYDLTNRPKYLVREVIRTQPAPPPEV